MLKLYIQIGLCFLPLLAAQTQDTITQSQSQFGLEFMGLLCDVQNCVFSPYSIYNILGMLLQAADGRTEAQLLEAMKLSGISNVPVLHELIGGVKVNVSGANLNDEVVVNLADNIFVSQSLEVKEMYIDNLKKYYDIAGPVLLNFGNSVLAAEAINGFVSDTTNGQITELFPAGSFNANTLAVLVNAIYLKADWETPFDSGDTTDADFYISKDEIVTVRMMELEHVFRYYISNDREVFELPYKNKDLAMYVVVPKKDFAVIRDSIEDVVGQLDDLGNSEPSKLKVMMPKFNFKDRTDLKVMLEKLGVKDVFIDGASDLSKMSNSSPYISDAVHEAKIQVDELGTVAAAATGASIQAESMRQEPRTIKVDKPFIYMIVYKPTNTLLFMGQVFDPTIEE